MASYAPLLVNLNRRAWNPDLINFDSSRWYGLPSYYVQKMFAENRGDVSLPTTVESPLVENSDADGKVASLYSVAARDEVTGGLIVKVVNANAKPVETEINLVGGKKLTGKGTAVVLTSENSTDENSLENPTKVSPRTEPVSFSGTCLKRSFPGNSFTVLRLNTKN
jgi:alpha-N-arabinofuranosidase